MDTNTGSRMNQSFIDGQWECWSLQVMCFPSLPPHYSKSNSSPQSGTRTQPKPTLGLEHTWLGHKPSQNPQSFNWDHNTWFQDLSPVQSLSHVQLLQPHWLQHARLPCPSQIPGACSNSCPLSQWCHPNISSSVVPFFSCPQSFPASGSFLMSQLFASGGQSIGDSISASVLPTIIQDWSPLGWTGWISLQSKDFQQSSPTPPFKSIDFSMLTFLYGPTLTSTWLLEKS